ncbi:MAG: hypothetical protein AAB337_03510 [Patescibacteria group bacterium]
MTHHRTLFPLLVIAMTLALVAMIFFSFRDRFEATLNNGNGRVDAVEYQSNAHAILKDLRVDLAISADDTARIVLLQQTQRQLLELIVPSNYKEIHLELVITLSQLASAYEAEDIAGVTSASSRWEDLVSQYSWIE